MWTVSGGMDHWLQQDVPSLWNESVLFKNCFLSALQVPRPGPAPDGRKQEWLPLCPELLALGFSNLTYRRSLESLLQVASSPTRPELLAWETMLLTAIPWGFWSSWPKAHPLKINGLELQANTVWRFEGPRVRTLSQLWGLGRLPGGGDSWTMSNVWPDKGRWVGPRQ